MDGNKWMIRLIAGLAAAAIGGLVVLAMGVFDRAGVSALVRPGGAPVSTGGAAIGGPFTLIDHTGQTVTDADYRGRLLVVYFGYTFCPDICPTELYTIGQAMTALGDDADRVQPIFITVDPTRDTAEHMAEYVTLFHPRMVGLTGPPDQIRAAARAYRVYYAKVERDEGEPYLMDHSAFVYLIGPDGSFLDVLPMGTSIDAMADAVRRHLPPPAPAGS